MGRGRFRLRRFRPAGRLGGCLRLHGTNQDMGVPALHARRPIDGSVGRQVFRKPHQQFPAEIRVSDFTPTKLHNCLHAISLLKESDGMILLEIVIVVVGVRPELELLYLYDVLLFFGFVRLLLHLVLVVSIIDCFRNRRHCRRRHYNEIETEFLSPPQGG